MVDQPRSKCAENGGIEAGVGEFQTEQVLPIDATAHRVGRLPAWRDRRLPSCGKQVRKVLIAEERAELIIEPELWMAVGSRL